MVVSTLKIIQYELMEQTENLLLTMVYTLMTYNNWVVLYILDQMVIYEMKPTLHGMVPI